MKKVKWRKTVAARFLLCLLVLMFVAVSSGLPAWAAPKQENPRKERYRQGELLVKFRPGTAEKGKASLHKRHGSEMIREFRSLGIQHIRLKKELSVEAALRVYQGDPNVQYAEPNMLVEATALPNDYRFWELWGLHNIADTDIDAPEAWNISTGNSNLVVAVIDTGVDYTHGDLTENMWVNPGEVAGNGIDDDGNGYVDDIYGINSITGTGNPSDDNGHGTHCAGTIGAVGNNGEGVAGVNWQVKVMGCKFLDRQGSGAIADAIECLQYIKGMQERGVNVVATSNSWGGGGYSQALYDAINAQLEILFIAAAGNDTASNDFYSYTPGGYYLPNLIAVAATDRNGLLADFSNYGGRSVHVGAPGVDILSTLPYSNYFGINGGYGLLSGTSMATPHVSGLAALIKAAHPAADWRVIKNLILAGGDNTAALQGKTITGRRINAYNSLACSNRPVLVPIKYPNTFYPGIPESLAVLSIDCGAAAGPVTVTVSDGSSITLADDGAATDMAAGDGIFSGTWIPTREDEALTFSSPAGTYVHASPLVITSISLGEGLPDQSYEDVLHARGGHGPYLWSLAGGQLPAGLTFDGATGRISGTVKEAGLFTFTVRVTDTLGAAATKDFTLKTGNDLVMQQWARVFDTGNHESPAAVAVDEQGNSYTAGNFNDRDSGISGIFIIKRDPAGNTIWNRVYYESVRVSSSDVAVDSAGQAYISGSRSDTLGKNDFLTIKLDSAGHILWTRSYGRNYDDAAQGIAVDGAGDVLVTGYSAPSAVEYEKDLVTIKYDADGNVVWSAVYPEGNASGRDLAIDAEGNSYVAAHDGSYGHFILKYDVQGRLAWTSFSYQNYYPLGVVRDLDGNLYVLATDYAGWQYTLFKYDAAGTLAWSKTRQITGLSETPGGIAVDNRGDIYLAGFATDWWGYNELQIIKYDPAGTQIWQKSIAGVDFAGEKGLALDGQGNLFIAATAWAGSQTSVATMKLRQDLSLYVMNSSLKAGATGVTYDERLIGSGGVRPYTWSVESGALPTGLALDPATGAITGVPQTGGSWPFAIRLTDTAATTVVKELSITIHSQLTIDSSAVSTAIVYEPYAARLTAVGGLSPYTWSVVEGYFPGEVWLYETGEISGTPYYPGAYPVTVQVTDGAGLTATKTINFKVFGITTDYTLPAGAPDTPYSYTLAAVAGSEPYTWKITSGALPSGLTLNATTGEISGKTLQTGSFYPTIAVTDAELRTVSKSFYLYIEPLTIKTGSLVRGVVNHPYAGAIVVSGGKKPYTWTLSSGYLPAGLTINRSAGEITGTPTTRGSSTFTIRVQDALGAVVSRQYTMSVVQIDLLISAFTAPATATAGQKITVSDTLVNSSPDSMQSGSTIGFFLSTDTVWDSTDTYVGYRYVSALAANGSNSGSASLTIPAGTSLGTYYLIAQADYSKSVPESNETNNSRYVTIFIQ